ncbi:MAG: zinc metallopeptidase [Coriobacteriales bacterium]|jgi:Zn-dependent membrane protease YugP|nr:zinc metallopeptidase [Coriobacteriales bacterium]
MNISYLTLIIITLVIGLGTQALIRGAYKKWNRVAVSTGITGAEAARRMLDAHGLHQVSIQSVSGSLTDHFDPRSNVVSLSQDVYSGRSVSATAIACHECGHAVQHAQGYVPAKMRGAIVPAVNFASNIWIFVLFAGLFMQMLGLIYLSIILYLAVIAFQLVTLPVEFDASRRALGYIKTLGQLPDQQVGGARTVLRSAALTYVAAALTSLLYLVWLLGYTRSN